MDIVYVLIGFACGFICQRVVLMQQAKRERDKFLRHLANMSVDEVKQHSIETTKNILKTREELRNGVNK